MLLGRRTHPFNHPHWVFEIKWDSCCRSPLLRPANREFIIGTAEYITRSRGALETTSDPAHIYLREMGVVPLLTREGEVDIAKRIERGQLRVLKALSRSPIVIRQILAICEDLKRGMRSIKEMVVFVAPF